MTHIYNSVDIILIDGVNTPGLVNIRSIAEPSHCLMFLNERGKKKLSLHLISHEGQ